MAALLGLAGAVALAFVSLGGGTDARAFPEKIRGDVVAPEKRYVRHLESGLARVVKVEQRRGKQAALKRAREEGEDVEGGRVRVVIEGAANAVPSVRSAARSHGAHIELRVGGSLQALLPPSALRPVAEVPGVQLIRRPLRLQPLEITGEGVGSTNANAWQSTGWTGAGVSVAILDTFQGYQESEAAGELPASVVTVPMCPSIGGFPGDSHHGTAVAEIVHEMAPAAQLYLICINTDTEFEAAVQYAIQNHISIINGSFDFPNGGRGDGTGDDPPDRAVKEARTGNILPVFAAGNSGQRHWSGNFSDLNGNGFEDFNGSDELNVRLPAPGVYCFALKWDDWPRSSQDYDLYLYDDLSGSQLKKSENPQQGLPDQSPTEGFCYAAQPGTTARVSLKIEKASATRLVRFDLFSLNVDLDAEYITPGSIEVPASSPYAMAVGADCWQSNVLEDYSSIGPTIDGRVKPDIVAPDSVSGSVYGPFTNCGPASTGFAGTSASAPHAAGAAALVKQAFPGFGADQLESYLEAHAIDMPPAGKDNQTGFGRLDLGTPPPLPPPPSPPPPPSARSTGCTSVRFARVRTVKVLRRGVPVRVRFPRTARCRVTVVLQRLGRRPVTIGSRLVLLRSPRASAKLLTRRVTVRINRAGRRLFKHHRILRSRVLLVRGRWNHRRVRSKDLIARKRISIKLRSRRF